MTELEFRGLPNLAARTLGATVIWTNDDFFADVHQLIAPGPPDFDAREFGPRGKVYDGWETSRRRATGRADHAVAIVRLAAPGVVRGLVIDTTHFKGNFPPAATVEGTTLLGYPDRAAILEAVWRPLVVNAGLEADGANLIAVDGVEQLITHVRLTLHPDGGVARLRVYGVVVPDPRVLGGRPDLAATTNGGIVIGASNWFYSSPANALGRGTAAVMSDGWETARRRDDGNDWMTIRLGCPGVLTHAVVDTSRFVGNSPSHAQLTDADSGIVLLERTSLLPDTEHVFRLRPAGPVCSVRLDIYPDGGISRLRMRGSVPEDLQEQIAQNWLGRIPADQADLADPKDFFA